MTGSNTGYTGGFDVQGGVLKVDSLANRIGTGYLALKGGTLTYTGTGIETASNAFWVDGAGASGTINIVNAGAVLTLNPASGTVNQELVKNGPGRLVLQGVISWLLSVPISAVVARPLSQILGETMIEVALDYGFAGTAVFVWLLIIIVIALVASYIPARNASRISVRESLAYG